MTEKQPLLLERENFVAAGVVDDDDDIQNASNKRSGRFFRWRRQLLERKDQQSEDEKPKKEKLSTNIFRLLRFADRTILILLCVGLFGVILQAVSYALSLVVLGRLTGSFADLPSAEACPDEKPLLTNNTSVQKCPLGIDLNSQNYDRLHRLCHDDSSTKATSPATSLSNGQSKMMQQIYWMLILTLIQFFGTFLELMAFVVAAKRLTSNMSVNLFKSIIQRNILYFDTNATGQFTNKLFNNIETINQGIGHDLAIMLELFICSTVNIIIALSINWRLTLGMLCSVPFIVAGSMIFSKFTSRETMNELNSYSKAGHIVEEVFSCLRTVLSFNGEEFEKKRYEKELGATEWSSVRKGASYGAYTGWNFLIVAIIYSIGFILGLILVNHLGRQRMSTSDVLVVVIIFAQGITLISFVGVFLQSFSEAKGATVETFRLTDEESDPNINERQVWNDNRPKEASQNVRGDIVFENVNFTYPVRRDVPVLHNFNLVARAGETTALVGPSGCGKSTCTSLLLRFYNPSSGTITVNGRPISDYNLKQLRKDIGIINQEPILFATTIFENIRYGRENATRAEIQEAARQANAHNFIMRLPDKYETLVGERGVQLSGGEKQRIALARALIKSPKILLLDEATSALDNVSEKIVQEALDRACEGRTTIVIAHRLSTIRNAHKICVLNKGQVIEEGTHETLMAKEGGIYQGMFKSQNMQRIENETDGIFNQQAMDTIGEQTTSEPSELTDSIRNTNEKKDSSQHSRQGVFLKLLAMNRPEWFYILMGCISCAVVGIAQPALSLVLVKLIAIFGQCANPGQLRQVLIFSAIMIAIGLATVMIRILQFSLFGIAGARLTTRIRARTFACLLRQEVAYFDRVENSVGAIGNRLSTNALAIQKMTGVQLGIISETSIILIFSLILGIIFNWQIAVIFLGCLLIVLVLTYVHVKRKQQMSTKNRVLSEKTSSLANEVIHNMRTVKHLMIEKTILQKYADLVQQSTKLQQNYSILSSFLTSAIWSSVSLTTALIYWRVLILIDLGKMEPQNTIIVYAFATIIMQAIRTTVKTFDTLGASLSSAESIFELFDRTEAIDKTSTEGQKLDNFRGNIEFDQVSFAYPSRPAIRVLNNFRLSIMPGQRIALIGGSGCGKSTIIQILERFYDVAHGQVRIDGVEIRKLDVRWLRSCFGLVGQEPILFDLTIAENISYGLEHARMEDIIAAATKANIHSFIQQLPEGYETRAGMKGTYLSGGQKQRIAIARTFLREPKILLLDEVTSAMDVHNEKIILQVLDQIQEEDRNRTSIMIAHRLSTIRSCDLICVVEKGRLIESGTHMELINRHGVYYSMISENNFD